ncbi:MULTISPECIES: carboxymuconolactone decarboxylase family protein [Oleiagrimonas]|uniref:Alkyl hydroperoxide reductase AhpD n=1 Tax=Oleiagrimonas citrea TaxID=1665687 RepID=A0A846ZN10_9GAMM|nr:MULTISPECIES: carboxymuconolactone decarboxylase family protein [Oleiagrimonas]NKZ39594.1 alkyl hydroperoxide reductase [Oleiagrimonas citrea]RAP59442.1 alkyl hydroperoxide reductase [Oleiagrimonas sp. MCCC 1A03011]
MSLAELKSQLPEYAKDLRLNLESVLGENGAPGLTQSQIAVVALASAIASRNAAFTASMAAWASEHADEDALRGARAAAAIMGMNNVYYRFLHLVENDEYATLRAGLRMNVMAKPGGSKIDFELASLAVSAINGCGSCVASHEKTLRKHEVGAQAVQSAARIAAVVHGVAVALEQAEVAGSSASRAAA